MLFLSEAQPGADILQRCATVQSRSLFGQSHDLKLLSRGVILRVTLRKEICREKTARVGVTDRAQCSRDPDTLPPN